MYYFYGRAIGGMEFVCCTEVVRLLESPLLEVSLYTVAHGFVPTKGVGMRLSFCSPNYIFCVYSTSRYWKFLF